MPHPLHFGESLLSVKRKRAQNEIYGRIIPSPTGGRTQKEENIRLSSFSKAFLVLKLRGLGLSVFVRILARKLFDSKLAVIQIRIKAAGRKKLGVRALLDNVAVLHNEN